MNSHHTSKNMVSALRVRYKRILRKFKAFMQLLESIDWALKEIRKSKPLLEAEPCGGLPAVTKKEPLWQEEDIINREGTVDTSLKEWSVTNP